MVRAGGSASRTISDSNTPDPGGGIVRLGNDRRMTLMDPDGPRTCRLLQSLTPVEKDRRDRAVQNRAAVVYKDSKFDPLCRPEWNGSHRAPLGRCLRAVGDSDNQQLMKQSRSGDNLSRQAGPLILKPAPAENTEQRRLKERSLPEVASELRQPEGPARIDQPEYTGSRPESEEAIVVGAIGSAAPWFHRMGPRR